MAVGAGGGRPTRIAVLRALGLGDLLTAVPALRALREGFPGAHLQLAAPAELGPLVLGCGLADEVVPTDLRAGAGPAPERPLDRRLHNADVAVNLHGAGPQSHRLLLATAPGRLIAFAADGLPAALHGPGWRSDEHEVLRWCRLLSESGLPADPGRLGIDLPAEALPARAGATVLHPGAAAHARRWPEERWVEVARAEAEAGREVILTGSATERPLALRIAERAGVPDSAVVAGGTGLLELAGVIASAARVVCGDTGVAHLATALSTPSVLLFGPTSPRRWGPPQDRPWHRVLWTGAEGDPHGRSIDPGLAAIPVEAVLAALSDIPPSPHRLAARG